MNKSIAGILILSAFSCVSMAQVSNNLTQLPPIEYQFELSDAKSEFFTVEVKGNNYERGYQHGMALKKVIRPAIARFKFDMINGFLASAGSDKQYEDYKEFFFEQTGLYRNAKAQVPELVEEIKGIADGAGLNFQDVFVYNLNFDETFWVLEKMTGVDPILAMEIANKESMPSGHCSHGSVWKDNQASVAYTLDWTRHFEGTQSLIKHVKQDGTVLLMTTYAGTLIGHGVNMTHGYTFTPHSKFQLEHDVDNGLAQIFVYRKLIEAGSVDKAIEFLKTLKPAAGLGYALTDKRGTRSFEVSANKITEFTTDGNWMAVANVARVNNDLSSSYRAELVLKNNVDMKNLPQKYWQYNRDSVQRFNMLEAAIKGKEPTQMTPVVWEKIFAQKPLNKPVDAKIDTSNLWHVVEIDETHITYHVSAGAPSALPLETYRAQYTQ